MRLVKWKAVEHAMNFYKLCVNNTNQYVGVSSCSMLAAWCMGHYFISLIFVEAAFQSHCSGMDYILETKCLYENQKLAFLKITDFEFWKEPCLLGMQKPSSILSNLSCINHWRKTSLVVSGASLSDVGVAYSGITSHLPTGQWIFSRPETNN